MPPLPVSELGQLFEPLTVDPQLLCNPLWTPVNGLEPFLCYRVRKMVYLLTESICDEAQQTFADQIGALYASDLSWRLPEMTFDFPPCTASMINILVQICDRVKLPDPADQAVLIPMLQMLRVAAYAWAKNQQLEREWTPYSAETGLFRDTSVSMDNHFSEVDVSVTVGCRYAVREEFRNLDFRTAKCLREYTNLPSLVRLTREHLEPMAEYFCHIQANFCWTAAVHSLQDLAHLADMLVRYREVAEARRLPVPRVPTLRTVMRAQHTFGFMGDEDKVHGAVVCGKLAALFEYSAEIRQHTIDGIHRAKPESVCRAILPMSQDYIPRMVTDVVEIQPYHEAQLDLFRSFRHHPSEYTHSSYGCLEYASQAVCPYGELILKAIPAGVHAPSMLPEGTHDQIMSRIRASDAICNTLHRSTDTQDLLLPHSITAVTAMPPWDRQRITEIRRAEARDPWACEAALLADEMALSDNLGDAFIKALKADLDGYPPNPRGRQAS
ncbi:hypothetical protein C8J57DRAFT_1230492 [Mycena rebaudengoi]|nr:hypothetical protein C8J57DRAFT_1230492 [Mycena rebaudengoi]